MRLPLGSFCRLSPSERATCGSARGSSCSCSAIRSGWKKLGRSEPDLPMLGVNRHIIIADTEAEPLDTARRGYPAWRHHMGLLWHEYNVPFPLEAALPEDFAILQEHGDAIAGTPAMVCDYIAAKGCD